MDFLISLENRCSLPYSVSVLEQKIKDKYGDYLTIEVDDIILQVSIDRVFWLQNDGYRKCICQRVRTSTL